ncbi:MAG: class I SAM-dependent methyltransferase [Dehalococcoidia bacterium]
MMMRIVDAAVPDVSDIADLGCGGGTLTSVLLEQHPKVRATLVDFSEPMIAEARKALASYGDSCEYVITDLSASGWAETVEHRSPFDVVVSG